MSEKIDVAEAPKGPTQACTAAAGYELSQRAKGTPALRSELKAIAECVAEVRQEYHKSSGTPWAVQDARLDCLVGKLANKFALYGEELRQFISESRKAACISCSAKGKPLFEGHCLACNIIRGNDKHE